MGLILDYLVGGQLSKNPVKIGIVGTAKNTGKTTTLITVYNFLYKKRKKIFITSIGYDGEDFDNITSLPKPRIRVHPNTIIATAEKILNQSKIPFKLHLRTGMYNPLGEILVVEILQDDFITFAGPTTRAGVQKLLNFELLNRFDFVLIDGSINRLAPLEFSDYLIFTTGPARSEKLDQLTFELGLIETVFNCGEKIKNDSNEIPAVNNLLHLHQIEQIMNSLKVSNKVRIDGVLNFRVFLDFISQLDNTFEIILNSPLTLIYSFELFELNEILSQFRIQDVRISFMNRPELLCFTINPTYPIYNGTIYKLSQIDSEGLKTHLTNSITIPIFDVIKSKNDFQSFLSTKLILNNHTRF